MRNVKNEEDHARKVLLGVARVATPGRSAHHYCSIFKLPIVGKPETNKHLEVLLRHEFNIVQAL